MTNPTPTVATGADPVPALVDEYFRLIDVVNASEDQALADRAFDQEEAVSARIVGLVATSPQGILAQLRMLRELTGVGGDGCAGWVDARDERLFASIEAGVERSIATGGAA